MSGVWGDKLKLSIFGESHGRAIGVVINNLPPGIEIDYEFIKSEMKRRAPGREKISTSRKEDDLFEIVSGELDGKTTGAPLCAMIWNSSQISKDYENLRYNMRPGHSDYPGFVKYKGFNDYRGGGHFSGRITAPLVFAGALAKSILKSKGITIGAHIRKVGKTLDSSFDPVNLDSSLLNSIREKDYPVIDDNQGIKMKEEILEAKKSLNSIGGIIEVGVVGSPVGIGNPFFDSFESKLAHMIFSVPATKGIEFGTGFGFADLTGKEGNDEFYMDNGKVKTYTNNNGGVTGGITNGMPIIFRTVIKPTASISQPQKTVNIKENEDTILTVEGRHDPCIVHRAVPVLESVTAITLLDFLLLEGDF